MDKHRYDLIQRVSNIKTIMDKLLTKGVIQQEEYERIGALACTQEKMRQIYCGPLKASGDGGKDIFYTILEENESYLITDLNSKE